jgi:two-component system LytT family response regulator
VYGVVFQNRETKPDNSKTKQLEEYQTDFLVQAMMKLPLIAIAQQKKYIILTPREIMYCVAEGSYCHIYMEDGEAILVSIKLKAVSEILQQWPEFVRIHHSYFINVHHLKWIEISDGWQACMSNGQLLPVSGSRKTALLSLFHVHRDKRGQKNPDDRDMNQE